VNAVWARGGSNDGPYGGVPTCPASRGKPPRRGGSAPPKPPAPPVWPGPDKTVDYVAMGDSYASGVSLGDYGSSGACKRSSKAYAYKLWLPFFVFDPAVSVRANLVACSGAKTADVDRTQLGALSKATDLVTISVGGDDLHFANLIKDCVIAHDGCSSELNDTAGTASSVLTPRLHALYAQIRVRVRPDTKVLVIGYPRLFPPHPHHEAFRCRDIILAGIQATEQDAGNHLADVLDDVIGSAARAAGFGYFDSIPLFTNHDVCMRHDRDKWMNAFIVHHIDESFHPKESGHTAWANAIAARLIFGQ
jgi:GDSL-like Lipase/Acylhydrolase family